MGRPREYDEEEVLEEAMLLFWSTGYEATSMSHLVEATGLAKGSLYQAFGDKQKLFLEALERYLTRGRQYLRECLGSAESGYAGLSNWMLENARQSTCSGIRKGCFAVNTAVELAPHNPVARKVLQAHERKMEQLYEACIVRGLEDGSLSSSVEPAACARWITTTIYGLQIRAKLGMTHKQGIETVKQALASIASG